MSEISVKTEDKSTNMFYLFILTAFLVEQFIGGGGDIFAIHFSFIRITVRMILFVMMLIVFCIETLLLILNRKTVVVDQPGKYAYLLLIYCFCSCLWGLLLGNNSSAVVGDFKPVLYLFAYLPIVSVGMHHNIKTDYILKLLYFSSSIVSIFSVFIFGVCEVGIISNYEMRILLSNYISDFGIRPNNGFVYSGQFYVLISDLILLTKLFFGKTKTIENILIVLFSATLLQASTRGPLLVLFIIFIFLIMKKINNKGGKVRLSYIFILMIIFFIVILFIRQFDFSRVIHFNDDSIKVRMTYIKEVFDIIYKHPVFGIGYGSYIPSYGTNHLEISLLEIFIEQGIIGVALWILFVLSVVFQWKNHIIIDNTRYYLKLAMPISVICVMLVSFTNPYLNNSLGISCICITMLILYNEKKYEKD